MLQASVGSMRPNSTAATTVALRRATQRDMPVIAARVLSERLRLPSSRQIDHFAGLTEAHIDSISPDADGVLRRFPVQVDGDYIGDHAELELKVDPGALTIVA